MKDRQFFTFSDLFINGKKVDADSIGWSWSDDKITEFNIIKGKCWKNYSVKSVKKEGNQFIFGGKNEIKFSIL